MHVLVTGGAGFIGSHLIDALLRRGDSVVVVDDFSSGSRDNLPAHQLLRTIEFQLGKEVPDDLGPKPIDAIVHLAGSPSVALSWQDPVEAHDRTLTTTVSLLHLVRRLNIPRFIFASSAAVYGPPAALPITEEMPCHPSSPYGLQKLVGEKYVELFAGEVGFSAVVLRLFNVFGPRQAPSSPYSGVISKFVEAFRFRRPITVFGDGLQTRDLIYVADVVAYICSALDLSIEPGETLRFNIGTGSRRSLLEIIAILQKRFADKTVVFYEPARAGDILHSQSDNSAAMRDLGISPIYSLEQGLDSLLDSYEPGNVTS